MKLYNHYIFATWLKTFITYKFCQIKKIKFEYLRFTPSVCKDIWIGKLDVGRSNRYHCVQCVCDHVQCAMYMRSCAVCAMCMRSFAVCNVYAIMCSVQCVCDHVQCAMCIRWCAVCNVYAIMCSVQCVCDHVQCAICMCLLNQEVEKN